MRRLLLALAEPPAGRAARHRWSRWRRAHQAAAQGSHLARRARDHPPPAVATPTVIVVPGIPALSAAAWAQIAPLLPANGGRGQQWRDHRSLLAAILWVMRSGAPWRELPAEFGAGKTAYDRYTRWRRDGIWARILDILLPPVETEHG